MANETNALCAGGSVQFDVATNGKDQTVTVVAGTIGLSPVLNATLFDAQSKLVSKLSKVLNSTFKDVESSVWHTITWTLQIKGTAGGKVSVALGGLTPAAPPPPPPPPPLPPCTWQHDIVCTTALIVVFFFFDIMIYRQLNHNNLLRLTDIVQATQRSVVI